MGSKIDPCGTPKIVIRKLLNSEPFLAFCFFYKGRQKLRRATFYRNRKHLIFLLVIVWYTVKSLRDASEKRSKNSFVVSIFSHFFDHH